MKLLTQLYDYQKRAVEKLSKIKVGALYMEQGTGKTRTALELISIRASNKKINAVLWLCPCSVKSNLHEDIIRHVGYMPENIVIKGIESLSNSEALYIKLLKMVKEYDTYLIVDESNLVKNKFAVRTDRIIKLSKLCTYKLILNGTPISKNEADLFAQWYILDWRILGYKSFYSFSANHLEYKKVKLPSGKEVVTDQIIRVLNKDYLVEKIEPYSYQIKKEEALLSLPPKHYATVGFNMPSIQRAEYEDTKNLYLFNVEEWRSETIYKLFTALQHVTSGSMVLTEPDERMKTKKMYTYNSNPRIQALIRALDDIGEEKCIIFAKYQEEINDISKMLDDKGLSYIEFTGKIKQSQRQKNRLLFKGPVQFMLANKQCGAYGLNLQFCRNIIYYSNDFDLATRLQSEDRVHQIGQHQDVYITDIVCNDTIDDFIATNLQNKSDLVAAFKANLEYWKKENLMKNISYERTSSREADFYTKLGYLFASKKIRKELHGYPLSNEDNWTWFIAREGKQILGFVSIEPQKTSYKCDTIHVLNSVPNKTADVIYKKMISLLIHFADNDKMAITATVPKVLTYLFTSKGFYINAEKGARWVNLRRDKIK